LIEIRIKQLKENNKRDRVLSEEEYIRLLSYSPAHIKPIIKLAYHTGMRQGEILGLTWDQIDLLFGIASIQKAFENAKKKAELIDFTFHDLRHTFINNRRLEGHDYFRIMAITGHKTMSVFKRYNTVSKEELRSVVGEKI
jgi:integrase